MVRGRPLKMKDEKTQGAAFIGKKPTFAVYGLPMHACVGNVARVVNTQGEAKGAENLCSGYICEKV